MDKSALHLQNLKLLSHYSAPLLFQPHPLELKIIPALFSMLINQKKYASTVGTSLVLRQYTFVVFKSGQLISLQSVHNYKHVQVIKQLSCKCWCHSEVLHGRTYAWGGAPDSSRFSYRM